MLVLEGGINYKHDTEDATLPQNEVTPDEWFRLTNGPLQTPRSHTRMAATLLS